jgi:hypothetical protein
MGGWESILTWPEGRWSRWWVQVGGVEEGGSEIAAGREAGGEATVEAARQELGQIEPARCESQLEKEPGAVRRTRRGVAHEAGQSRV